MRRLRFADPARADLRAIAEQSRQAWGRQANNVLYGRVASQDTPAPRGAFLGVRHLIFHEVTDDRVVVLRIFHDSMDYSAHLKPHP